MENLTSKQYQKIKSSVVDSNIRLNSLFPFFDNFHGELSAGFCLVDNFPNHFSFYIVNHKEKEIRNTHVQYLNKVFKNFFSDSNIVVIITDVSIKKDYATSISHVYFSSNIIAKTIYQAVNVMSTEVELFTIRCGINQTVQVYNVAHIIVITDIIHFIK